MNRIEVIGMTCLLAVSIAPAAVAEADAGKTSLDERVFGYWAVDKDRMLTGMREDHGGGGPGFGMMRAILEDLEMFYTVEIRDGELHYPGRDGAENLSYVVKSLDVGTGALELEFSDDEGGKHQCTGKLSIDDSGLSLADVQVGEEEWSGMNPMLLMRIDEAVFKRRLEVVSKMAGPDPDAGPVLYEPTDPDFDASVFPVAEALDQMPGFVRSPYSEKVMGVSGMSEGTLVLEPGFPAREMKIFRIPKLAPLPDRGDVPEVEMGEDGYPVGRHVPGKPGFVFSPFNNSIIDVRGIPPGTLLADPAYPPSAKKHFRMPGARKAAAEPETSRDGQ